MGGGGSKPQPAPFLSKPWRKISWGNNQKDLQYVRNYKPQTGQQLRILLHGPAGAGMSSFINSVQSVLRGRMYTHALAANTCAVSVTKQYTTYKIQNRKTGNFYPFVFNDIMGLEENRGVPVDDVKLALRGRVKEGYKFNPDSTLSEDDKDDEFYNNAPNNNNKVHVLVYVVPANTIFKMPEEIVQKIKDIREDADKLRIPQVAIFTKIDEVCPEIEEDLKNVYKVKYLKRKMEQFSAYVGIPMNCIFPVKNYHEEINLNDDVDTLILSALSHIITFGDDCINFRRSNDRLIYFNAG